MTGQVTEQDGILRAILEDPEDDTVRLAYADYLDETGASEYANFIRGQIAGGTGFVGWSWLAGIDTLMGFEPHTCAVSVLNGSTKLTTPRGAVITFKRGFACAVTCNSRALLGVVCRFCRGTGNFQTSGSYSECPRCPGANGKGTGRITQGFATELFSRHPVETVLCPDLEPWTDGHDWSYWRDVDPEFRDETEPGYLDGALYASLAALYRANERTHAPEWPHVVFATRDGAESALSRAIVSVCRGRAGLRPLSLEE